MFTILFNKKVDDAHVKDIIDSLGGKKPKDMKKIAQDLITGKEVEMTCCLGSSDGFLGRSLVFDLNQPHGRNFRQIDHRTIKSLIIKNIKYTVK